MIQTTENTEQANPVRKPGEPLYPSNGPVKIGHRIHDTHRHQYGRVVGILPQSCLYVTADSPDAVYASWDDIAAPIMEVDKSSYQTGRVDEENIMRSDPAYDAANTVLMVRDKVALVIKSLPEGSEVTKAAVMEHMDAAFQLMNDLSSDFRRNHLENYDGTVVYNH